MVQEIESVRLQSPLSKVESKAKLFDVVRKGGEGRGCAKEYIV